MGIYEVHKTGLLIDARDYYKAFYHTAIQAKHYIFLAGWQFDSEVKLLRGEDASGVDEDIRLLPFLNNLCKRNPELEVYILAWDFSVLFALDREWFQEWIFNWTSNKCIHFRFDDRHAVGASHHQKFVVIDGKIAFIGGLDICSNRWDDRRHLPENPERINPDDKPYEPYHDVQSCNVGSVALAMAEFFKLRWKNSGGGELHLPDLSGEDDFEIQSGLPIDASRVAISRTQGKTLIPLQKSILEIKNLYLDAINAAENLIYIENQYFTSQAVYGALMQRMNSKDKPKLQIVIVLPRKPHALIEEISMGAAQTKMLFSLQEMASRNGHSVGIYYTVTSDSNIATYIHAKLMIVDDRFMTVGSANTTNRSMGLDTELNVSWEEFQSQESGPIRSIREARINLLLEHTGLDDQEKLGDIQGLVDFLNDTAEKGVFRLRHHTMETIFGNAEQLKKLGLEKLSIDPEKPIIEENVFELLSKNSTGLFSKGITWLNKLLMSKSVKNNSKAWDYKVPETGKHRHRTFFVRFKYIGYGLLILFIAIAIILLFLFVKK
ncbi:MAG: phospholipase [Nitrospirae bacterium]|jgi:phospholipase D1/2|nr:phospholipase [Nitrospirota bacterium]